MGIRAISSDGVGISFTDGTEYVLRKNRFPAAQTASQLEIKLQALLDQFVNPKLWGACVAIHVFDLGPPVIFKIAQFSNTLTPPPNWWVD